LSVAHPFIAIEGVIGVGKTTLARILGEALPAEVLLEVFEENPFLSDFYADRARYAFQTQIFFLLSRYRQQHRVIAQTLRRSPLVSDYLFDKDWLFAHLNLAGDELAMYERVYAILGEQIPTPELVVYLRADTETLMDRIVLRDRAYERRMSREYIEALRVAYEAFFAQYDAAPVLAVDTEDLDLVRDPEARVQIGARVRNELAGAGRQLTLPEIGHPLGDLGTPRELSRRLLDLQRFHRTLDQRNGAPSDVFLDYLSLSQGVGRLGAALREVWVAQDELIPRVGNRQEARDRAIEAHASALQDTLADALDLLLKIANDAGVDLERAYLGKLERTESGEDAEPS
jgi:deoxyadenosine/deoxycytidine kinase